MYYLQSILMFTVSILLCITIVMDYNSIKKLKQIEKKQKEINQQIKSLREKIK